MSLSGWKRKLFLLNLVFVVLFGLLIYKDPFSERTLIPNFEPYPDTFFYINPALSLIKGDGMHIVREGRVLKPNVPPLYSLTLAPVFLIRQDPRMAYYVNVILAFASLFLFWAILRKLFTNKLIIYLLLLLYTTNYFIYWMPTLVMAENLTLTLFLAALFFLLSRVSKINLAATAFLAIAIYATKYANIPISIAVAVVYLIKIIFFEAAGRKVYTGLVFLAAFAGSFLLLAAFEWLVRGNNLLAPILGNLSLIFQSVPQTVSEPQVSARSSWFGIEYMEKNLPLYINSLIGNPNRFLWDQTPLIPKLVGIFGLTGILAGIIRKKTRLFALSLFLPLSALIVFMLTFYSFDARYIYIAIPTLLFGLGLFLGFITETPIKKVMVSSLILIAVTVYLITSFTRIKSQISINLRYAETPWNYIAILKTNEYFSQAKIINGKKPVLISALPPFLVDYFSNGNYTLLPLAYQQEFRSFKEEVWGPNDYSDFIKLYKKYLNDGFDVYVSRAGLGNEGYTNHDFDTIVAAFNTQIVFSGCYDQCNIYSVKLKDK
jgi:hypothetical protein